MELPSIIRISVEVAKILEELGIPHLIGGSIASSTYGDPRSTFDADLVADFKLRHVQPFSAALSESFYVEPERIIDAIRRRASFNIIHHRTGLKVDIFIQKDDPLARLEMARRQRIPPFPGAEELPMATPEDVILQKLHWYQTGNGISDRQWLDILGILKIQRRHLDFRYLERWAPHLRVEKLLRKAYEDARIIPTD